jgi:hypothetical protein
MGKFLGGILIGLILGGAITFVLFVGVPRASQVPGRLINPPDAIIPPGTAQIVLRQDFFNEVLTTVFRDMNKPTFDLASVGVDDRDQTVKPTYAAADESQPCDGKIRILPEGSGVQTGLRFDNNRVAAPLAFAGSLNSPFGCFPFTGWAQADLELRYDNTQQVVFGHINVETVNLDGVNPLLNGLVTPLVQSTLNNRVNPIRILDGKQIAVDMPVASAGGRLNGSVNDVRADVKDNALNLYVTYNFNGTPLR